MEIELKTVCDYSFNENKYRISLVNDKGLLFTRKDEKKYSNNLSSYELCIGLQVLDQIAIRKEKSVFIGKRKIKSNVYKIFYDTHTRLYWWEALNGLINNEDNYRLNLLYNNVPDAFYLQKDSSIKSNNKDRKIKITKKIGGVLVSISIISLSTLIDLYPHIGNFPIAINTSSYAEVVQDNAIITSEDTDISDWSNIEEFSTKEDKVIAKERRAGVGSTEYDWNTMKNAIDSNKFLNDDEKAYLYLLKDALDEDHKYMYLPLIEKSFKSLRCFYKDNIPEGPVRRSKNVKAIYSRKNDAIIFWDAYSIKDADPRDVIHELGHDTEIPSPGKLHEYVNVIWQTEYLKKLVNNGLFEQSSKFLDKNGEYTDFGNGYDDYIPRTWLLLNVVGKNVSKKYHYQTDESILVNRLVQIDDSEDEYMKKYERACRLIDLINQEISKDDFETVREYEDECERREISFYKDINYYYEKVFGKTAQEDLNAVIAHMGVAYYHNIKLDGISRLYVTEEGQYYDADKTLRDMFAGGNSACPLELTGIPKNVILGEDPAPKIFVVDGNKKSSIDVTYELEESYFRRYRDKRSEREGEVANNNKSKEESTDKDVDVDIIEF